MSKSVIGALRVNLGLDSAKFSAGVKTAQTSLGRLQGSVRRAGKQMQGLGRAMSARVTAPLVAGTALMVRSSLSTIDAQAKMAQSIGTSTASLQVLARAADRAGISQGELEGSLIRLTRRVSLAEQGMGPAVKAFETLGIASADLVDLDAAERVKLIQDRLAEFVPEAERAAVASQIFGDRTGLAMLRLDAGTIDTAAAELERFGVTVSDIDADKIEAANDAMSGLGLAARGLGNQITVALAPTLTAISEKIASVAEWFAQLSPETQKFTGIAVAMGAAIGPIAIVLGTVTVALGAILSPIGLVVAAFAGLAAGVVAIVANWDSLSERFPIVTSAIEGFINYIPNAVSALGDFVVGIATMAMDAPAAISQMGSDMVDAIKAAALTLVDASREMGANIIDGLKEGIAGKWGEIKAYIGDLASSLPEWIKGPLGINSPSRVFMEIGKNLMDGLGIGVDGASGKVAGKMQEIAGSLSKDFGGGGIWSDFQSGAEGAIQSVISGSKKLGDALRDFVGDALSDITSKLASNALSSVFGSIGLDWFGGANAKGNAFSGGNVIPFAKGGVVTSPAFFPMSGGRAGLMGEAGPEAIMPLTRGPGGKLGVQASGGGAANVQVVVNNYSGADVQTETRQGANGQTIQEIVVREMKRAHATGQMDRPMGARHGIAPRRLRE